MNNKRTQTKEKAMTYTAKNRVHTYENLKNSKAVAEAFRLSLVLDKGVPSEISKITGGHRVIADDGKYIDFLMGDNPTYFKGDLARYTGEVVSKHGGLFYEIEILEGHLKGELKHISKAPKGYI